MYPDWSVFVSLATTAGIWLGILTFFVFRQYKFLKLLFPKSGERDIRKKFEEVTQSVADFEKELSLLSGKIFKYQTEGQGHIQKVALLRFNPYHETGGDQSFTVCFLNSEGTGIVITSLHARSGTRVFGKEIVSGKSVKYELSKEEELVIKQALE